MAFSACGCAAEPQTDGCIGGPRLLSKSLLTQRAVDTAMRWTGASERTVKYWLSAERRPSGEHLIALARLSGAVFRVVLALAGHLVEDDDGAGR
jgi:hypothetical protein